METGFYNAGFENLSILEVANLVSKKIPTEIEIKKNNKDVRSYRQNSDKLLNTGFKKNFSVKHAIDEVYNKFLKKEIEDKENCYTVNWMKKIKI